MFIRNKQNHKVQRYEKGMGMPNLGLSC